MRSILRDNSRSGHTVPAFVRTSGPEGGFTLLEVMAVVVIVAILATTAIMNVDSIVPAYEIRQTARRLGIIIQQAKSYAKREARDMAIVYDFENNRCWIEPADIEPEDTPGEHTRREYELPEGLEFSKVVFSDESSVEINVCRVYVTAGGMVVPHYVHIKNDRDAKYTVMVRMMAGTVEYAGGHKMPEEDYAASDE